MPAPPVTPATAATFKKAIVGSFIVLALYVVVFAFLLGGEWVSKLRSFPPQHFALFILMVTTAYIIRTLRWCFLARRLSIQIPALTAAQIYVGGFPMSLSPGRIGELWRAWILNTRFAIPYKKGIFITFFDRWLDLNILLLFAALGFFASTSQSLYYLPAAVAALGIAAVICVVILPTFVIRLLRMTARHAKKANRARARKLAILLCIVCQQIVRQTKPAIYLPALLLSLVAWCIEAAAFVFAAQQLAATLPALHAALTIGISNIAGVITLLPAGVGGQEFTMLYLLEQLGNNTLTALTLIAVFRLGTTFYGTLLGLPLFIIHLKKAL